MKKSLLFALTILGFCKGAEMKIYFGTLNQESNQTNDSLVGFDLDMKEYFTQRKFSELIDLHKRGNNSLIIARVLTDDGTYYYDAFDLNQYLFNTNGLYHNCLRFWVDNVNQNNILYDPITKSPIIDKIFYYQFVDNKLINIGNSNELSIDADKEVRNKLQKIFIDNMLAHEIDEIVDAMTQKATINMFDVEINNTLITSQIVTNFDATSLIKIVKFYLKHDYSDKRNERVKLLLNRASKLFNTQNEFSEIQELLRQVNS